MKKIIVISLVVILIIFSVLLIINFNEKKEAQYIEDLKAQIGQLFADENYPEAINLLNQLDEKYIEIASTEINTQIEKICAEAEARMSEEDLLYLKELGYKYSLIDETIEKIQSKKEELTNSAANYELAVARFEEKKYDEAQALFSAVIQDDNHYSLAQEYLQQISALQNSWESVLYCRSTYMNACAYDGEYIYLAFYEDDVDGIYKIKKDGSTSQFFPLGRGGTRLQISDINIVGDYIYFIAGEKVGSGYVFNNPYNIYRMKKDGTELTIEIEGNFIDLIIEKDAAYAISREYGLIKFDKYFSGESIISSHNVIEFSIVPGGIYYTVRESLEYDGENTVYFYDGTNSQKIDSGENMHYQSFDGGQYLKWMARTESAEYLYLGGTEEEIRVAFTDLCTVYGIIDSKVLYSRHGMYQQEFSKYYDIESKETISKSEYAHLEEYHTLELFYEENKLIVTKDGKLYFSDITGTIVEPIVDAELSEEMLDENTKVIKRLTDDEIYLAAGESPIICVISDKQYWHYKDDKMNLYIEKKYMDEYDSNVYITHIFTNDYSLFKTGNGTGYDKAVKTYQASYISDMYQIIYGQNTDMFLDSRNADRGIIIRNGEVIKDALLYDMIAYFADGSMQIYRRGDDISAQQLVSQGAVMSFSFGPVLVEDYEIDEECAYHKLAVRNPRSAIGYVEPGHYVMVVCDGRDDKVSVGLSMIQLAQVFEDEGCRIAYNLDGGTTSTITFFGNYITRRTAYPNVPEIYNHRELAEMFYIGTSELSPYDLEEVTYSYEDYAANLK